MDSRTVRSRTVRFGIASGPGGGYSLDPAGCGTCRAVLDGLSSVGYRESGVGEAARHSVVCARQIQHEIRWFLYAATIFSRGVVDAGTASAYRWIRPRNMASLLAGRTESHAYWLFKTETTGFHVLKSFDRQTDDHSRTPGFKLEAVHEPDGAPHVNQGGAVRLPAIIKRWPMVASR